MKRVRFQGHIDIGDESFQSAFIKDGVVIDCPEIRIIQRGSQAPIEYASPGFIQVSAKKGVVVRMVCRRLDADSYDPLSFLRAINEPTVGVILPEHHYYRLEARDVAGQVWTCEHGDLDRSDRPEAVTLVFTAAHIRSAASSDGKKPLARLVFLDKLNFPKNAARTTTVEKAGKPGSTSTRWDLSEGSIGDLRLHFFHADGRPDNRYWVFVAEGDGDVEVPLSFRDRLLEAIRFCTATMATPVMSEVVNAGIRVIELSQARKLNKGLIEPPIDARRSGSNFYELFGCYYRYTCSHAAANSYSPLSAKIAGLFALKGVWIETVILLLCVAVERLLGEDEFKRLGKTAPDVQAQLDEVIAVVAQLKLGEPISNRVGGALKGLQSSRTADRLHALAEAGALEADDRKLWNQRRNAAAHGSFEIAPEEYQQVVDAAFRLLLIIYKLVFMCIGYSGTFTNFAVRGWPLRRFELESYRAALANRPS